MELHDSAFIGHVDTFAATVIHSLVAEMRHAIAGQPLNVSGARVVVVSIVVARR